MFPELKRPGVLRELDTNYYTQCEPIVLYKKKKKEKHVYHIHPLLNRSYNTHFFKLGKQCPILKPMLKSGQICVH